MPQADTNEDETHWDDDVTEEKIDSAHDHQDSNESAMDIDSPNASNESEQAKPLENGYSAHETNGDATTGDHIKVEMVDSDRMLNEDTLKVNGVDIGENGSLNADGNIQIFEDAKVNFAKL
jgi:hypothetical protein